jgi:hypothetical protein
MLNLFLEYPIALLKTLVFQPLERRNRGGKGIFIPSLSLELPVFDV